MAGAHQIETMQGFSADQLILLAYATLQRLNWKPLTAEPGKITATTSADKGAQLITIEAAPSTIIVKSEMLKNETWGLGKKNRRNVEAFISAMEAVRLSAVPGNFSEWEHAVAALQQETIFLSGEREKEMAEVDAVMNFSNGSRTITYTIIGVNVMIFIWMLFKGVPLFSPGVTDLLQWGGNYKPLTAGGEWWRIISSMFVHVGLVHLMFNMYALFMAGIYLEPMLGKARFVSAYLATGIFSSIASIWWNQEGIVSAGASGAIFGIYGVFLALLTTPVIPASVRKPLLTSIGVFVFFNLVYGAGAKGIDNAAHLGGLLSGFAFGYAFLPGIRKPSRPGALAVSVIILVVAAFSAGLYLFNAVDHSAAYEKKINRIMEIQEQALAPLQYVSQEGMLRDVSTISQPKWQEAKAVIEETASYVLPSRLKKHRLLMKEYIDLRIEHTDLVILALQEKEDVKEELQATIEKINAVVEKMGAPED